VQLLKGARQEFKALARGRGLRQVRGEFISAAQDVDRGFFSGALLEGMLRAGPPGQTSDGLAPSGRAGPRLALGVGAKKQGEPRLTRYGLRCKEKDQDAEK
jgi:hypothetical protein